MIRVSTGSRLHFGLFRLPPAGPWPAGERFYGGVGMMVERPGVRVSVEATTEWSAVGPLADRAVAIARRCAFARPHQVTIEECAPEHAGLGTGTQLSLAIAQALAASAGRDELSVTELARLTGRGRRSSIGIHGFVHGGLLVDAGKQSPDELAPLAARAEFPAGWRVVLLTPAGAAARWHGPREEQALAVAGANIDDALCRLSVGGLLPALVEGDLAAFGDALFEFNSRAGEPFRAAQGGPYASSATADLVAWLREQGVRGAGQSSWGQTVFGIVGDAGEAAALAAGSQRKWDGNVITIVTAGRNAGASCGHTKKNGGTAR